ncbi:MAG TPA: DUF885 family protein [Gemmatimonadales bacterium]|nr:DUF885 family protein [Gemmatimonadales bacterium]
MTPLDGLLQSYLDLRWHFDPAAASAAGVVSADARLGAFDPQAMREHLAAFRAVAAAVEDLEIEALEDEIDRTALLGQVRATVARLEQERPQARDPGFWIEHLRDGIAALLARESDPGGAVAAAAAARITAAPAFLDAARATLRRPPALLVDRALAMLGPTGEVLVRAATAFGPDVPGGPDALNPAVTAALQALTRFGTALRDEIEPAPDPASLALGEERFDRRLHEEHAIRSGTAELWRYASQLIDETAAECRALAREVDAAAEPPACEVAAVRELADAQLRAADASPSAVRRSLRAPIAPEGWALYAEQAVEESGGLVAPESRLRRRRRLLAAAGRLAADIGLHARGMTPLDAARLLERSTGLERAAAEATVREVAARPALAVGAAGLREILRLRRAYRAKHGEDPASFHRALLVYAALSPGLAEWGMGLAE